MNIHYAWSRGSWELLRACHFFFNILLQADGGPCIFSLLYECSALPLSLSRGDYHYPVYQCGSGLSMCDAALRSKIVAGSVRFSLLPARMCQAVIKCSPHSFSMSFVLPSSRLRWSTIFESGPRGTHLASAVIIFWLLYIAALESKEMQ